MIKFKNINLKNVSLNKMSTILSSNQAFSGVQNNGQFNSVNASKFFTSDLNNANPGLGGVNKGFTVSTPPTMLTSTSYLLGNSAVLPAGSGSSVISINAMNISTSVFAGQNLTFYAGPFVGQSVVGVPASFVNVLGSTVIPLGTTAVKTSLSAPITPSVVTPIPAGSSYLYVKTDAAITDQAALINVNVAFPSL
jgi:hypothetical protein